MSNDQRACEAIRQNKIAIEGLLLKYGVEDFGVFGSVARGQDRIDSDVDLLVKLKDKVRLLDLALLKLALEKCLDRPVDLLTHGGLDKSTLDYFLKHTTNLDMHPLVAGQVIDKHSKNIDGLLWVIDRIESACQGLCQEDFRASELLKDGLMRNIQLMGHISWGVNLEALDEKTGQSLMALRALETMLYKMTDDHLLWHMVSQELGPLKACLRAYKA